MRARLRLIGAAALVIGLARAATAQVSDGTYAVARVPYAQRIAIIHDSRWPTFNNNNLNSLKQSLEATYGETPAAFQAHGAQVDYYESWWFDQDKAHADLYRNLGSQYPVALLWGFTTSGNKAGGQSDRRKYFNADSTTAQLVVLMGSVNAANITVNDTTYGTVDYEPGGAKFTGTNGSTTGGAISYNATRDTLWPGVGPVAVRCAVLPGNVTSVVRLFQPYTVPGSASFCTGGDPAGSVEPAVFDSTAKPNEIMPIAWRVYFDGGPKHVDYIKNCPNPQEELGPILYAMVSRYAQLDRQPWSQDHDDMTDLNPTNAVRASNATMESLYTVAKANYGISPYPDVNPRHLQSYLNGTNPDYETAWPAATTPHTYLNEFSFPFIIHSHDSTGANAFSNLVGRFGGYNPGNGTADSSWALNGGTAIREVYTHRVANAFVPGGTNSYTWGIVQRLVMADSVRRALMPNSMRAPYLTFPNNEMLPIGWRVRHTWWPGKSFWKSYNSDSTGTANPRMPECPPDSVFRAFCDGLGMPRGGTVFVRSLPPSAGANSNFKWRPYGDGSVFNVGRDEESDSVLATSFFYYPGERYSYRQGGGMVNVRNIGCVLAGAVSQGGYRGAQLGRLAVLLGIDWRAPRCENRNLLDGESTSEPGWSDSQGQRRAGVAALRAFSAWQHPTVVYSHPNPPANGFGTGGDQEGFYLMVAQPMRALAFIAGHDDFRYTAPWLTVAP